MPAPELDVPEELMIRFPGLKYAYIPWPEADAPTEPEIVLLDAPNM